jgi:crotonobetainyl-CoA:carnitine CoA-transferase CaiB-like acyl-CoA transferase
MLDSMVATWVGARTQVEVVAEFSKVEAAIAPIYDISELIADPHVQARGTFRRVEDPDLGPLLMPEVIARLSRTPGSIRSTGRALGADTEAVLSEEVGVSDEAIKSLRDRGVIA